MDAYMRAKQDHLLPETQHTDSDQGEQTDKLGISQLFQLTTKQIAIQ